MENGVFVVSHEGRIHGPFLSYEVNRFVSTLQGKALAYPLIVPNVPGESQGPLQIQMMDDASYRAHLDAEKIDVIQALRYCQEVFYLAQRDARVLTSLEIVDLWRTISTLRRTIESLMLHVEEAIQDPKPEKLVELRQAFWRNRDSDDFDPDYKDRFG